VIWTLQRLIGRLVRVSPKTPLGRLLRAPLGLLPRGACLPVVSGPLRGARWIFGAATQGCWLGTYETKVQVALCNKISAGDVVYDIGANVGFHTLLASRCTGSLGKVYAFEPLPRNLDLLAQHVAVNNLENVSVVEIALAKSQGKRAFTAADNPSMGRLSLAGELTVETASLDTLIAEGSIQPPNLMKIDVEGSEGEVLAGGARCIDQYRPLIVLAVHGGTARTESFDFLTARGYSLASLDRTSLDDSSEILADPGAASA